MPRSFHQNRPASAPHAGIDHDDMDSSSREPMPGLRQHKRRLVELVGRDFVSNVNNAYPRRNAENHTFHRAHEVIGVSEVGGQSDQQGTLSPDHSRIVRVVEPWAYFSVQLACGVGYLWPMLLCPVVGMLKILRAVIGIGYA